MAGPVLVRAYTGKRIPRERAPSTIHGAEALPPISSYAFQDILRAADSDEFQTAIDGIAEICAKNRMSLADEYASHLPPLGEITAATSSQMRPHMFRPGGGMRRALTTVAEGSSGSSEGSRKSKKRGSIFSFRKQDVQDNGKPMRQMRIGNMGRTVSVGATTALTSGPLSLPDRKRASSQTTITAIPPKRQDHLRSTSSAAQSSLQRLLAASRTLPDG